MGSIPKLGRSPGGGNGNPLQYSCLEIPQPEEPGGLQSMGSQRVGHNWAWASVVYISQNWFSQNTIKSSQNYFYMLLKYISSVQSFRCVQLLATPWTVACQASLSITNSQSLPKLMSTELVMPSSHLILCRPLLLLPSILPRIRVFSNESTLHMRWPKYWSFSFSISPTNEHPGLISFRMDWLDLLAVQGTLKSLLQHHTSKASILLPSAFLFGYICRYLVAI